MRLDSGMTSRLSVVIPTTARRESIFFTINSILKQRDSESNFSIEIVINPLNNDKLIVDRLVAMKSVETRFHSQPHDTAEASAMWAASTSKADWVWLIGDDDKATPGSLAHVTKLIEDESVDFWLLNLLCTFDWLPLQYYRVGPRPIQKASSLELWKKCGFFSLLTTISSFVIRREVLDIDLFEEFHDIQGIYSHSVSLLAMLKNSQVGMTDFFCVERKEMKSDEIFSAMQSYISSRKIDDNYIWTRGALALLNHLAKKIDCPLEYLLNFREIEIIKDPRNSYLKSSDLSILVSTSGSLIARFVSSFTPVDDFFTSDWIFSESSRSHLIFSAPVRVSIEQIDGSPNS